MQFFALFLNPRSFLAHSLIGHSVKKDVPAKPREPSLLPSTGFASSIERQFPMRSLTLVCSLIVFLALADKALAQPGLTYGITRTHPAWVNGVGPSPTPTPIPVTPPGGTWAGGTPGNVGPIACPAGGGAPPAGGGGHNSGAGGSSQSGSSSSPPGTASRATGVRVRAKTTSVPSWERWWALHEEGFLQLRGSARARSAASDDRDEFLGAKEGAMDLSELTTRQIRADILPALFAAAEDEAVSARASALIALAKTADPADPRAVEILRAALADESSALQEIACLSLGLLGATGEFEALLQIAEGQWPEGIKHRRQIQARVRYAAALGLGLAGRHASEAVRPAMVERLLALAVNTRAPSEAQVGAAFALQLLRNGEAVPGLLQIVRNSEASGQVRAHAALALGKMKAFMAIQDLRAAMADRDAHLARSATLSLGLLANASDVQTLALLEEAAGLSRDAGQRQFAMLSLGEIGGERARAALLKLLTTSRAASERSFAALALGLSQFRHQDLSDFEKDHLLGAFEKTVEEEERAALTLALALAEVRTAGPLILSGLSESGRPKLQAASCLALGMLGDRTALPAMRTLLVTTVNPEVAEAAAKGLGLLRDSETLPPLNALLAQGQHNIRLLSAAAVALGHLGDRSTALMLKEIVDPKGNKSWLQRAFASIGLGLLGDRETHSRLAAMQEHTNFLSLLPVEADFLTIL